MQRCTVALHRVEEMLLVAFRFQERADFIDRKIEAAEVGDHAGGLDLLGGIVTVIALWIDVSGDEQTLVVVKTKRLHSKPGDAGELADREEIAVRVLIHGTGW